MEYTPHPRPPRMVLFDPVGLNCRRGGIIEDLMFWNEFSFSGTTDPDESLILDGS